MSDDDADLGGGTVKGEHGTASSFYLFKTADGKKKLAYGKSPDDALEVLRMRLTDLEMTQVERDGYIIINHKDIRKYVGMLG